MIGNRNHGVHRGLVALAAASVIALCGAVGLPAVAWADKPEAGGAAGAQGSIAAQGVGSQAIDYTPKLFKMLAYTNRMDTRLDEFRMDFMVRVAHDQVNIDNPTQCASGADVSQPRSCGIQMFYNFYPDASNLNPSNPNRTSLTYLNTANGQAGAVKWAENTSQVFTIHSILASGDYDYLSISAVGDRAFLNVNNGATLGGTAIPEYVFVDTGKPRTSISGDFSSGAPRVNIAAGYSVRAYSGLGTPSGTTQYGNGPRSFVGYDDKPTLWSDGQSNWGLVTDYGFAGVKNEWNQTYTAENAPEGTAPPYSFFLDWNNPAWLNAPCQKTTSYYFQWLGLANGKDWVPVRDLTPTAKLVTGQKDVTGNGTLGQDSSFNAPAPTNSWPNFQHPSSNSLMATDADGNLMPAQKADGSIDFKKAKDDQESLDGYFKLVTWPVTTNKDDSIGNCAAAPYKDAYNPLYDQAAAAKGVTAGMPQSEAQAIMDKGWDVNTAFYKFSVPAPEPPTIDEPDDNAQILEHPTLKGRGTPGYTVHLYAEEPGHIISESDPDNVGTRGRFVGTALVNSNGDWEFQDMLDTNPNPGGVGEYTQRYHAWQVEPDSGYELASKFSNIQTVRLGAAPVSPAPVVSSVEAPHTVNGELPAGSMVKIHGTATTYQPGEKLSVYAQHEAAANAQSVRGARTAVQPQADPAPGDLLAECDHTFAAAGENQPWTCSATPSTFTSERQVGERYVIRAILTNPQNMQSAWSTDTTVRTIDMTPSRFADVALEGTGANAKVGGKAYRLPEGTEGDQGAVITVIWPNGSTGATTVAADGSWSFAVPNGMTSGLTKFKSDDTETNESVTVDFDLKLVTPIRQMPMTGDRPQNLMGLVACLVVALLSAGSMTQTLVARCTKSGKAVEA